MSWEIVLFSYKEPITSIPDIDEDKLVPVNFDEALLENFPSAKIDDGHVSVEGDGFSIEFFLSDEAASNKLLSLYGETALFELIPLAVKNNWQIYDAGIDDMIDLNNPAVNGYCNYKNYVQHSIENASDNSHAFADKPVLKETLISKMRTAILRIFAK